VVSKAFQVLSGKLIPIRISYSPGAKISRLQILKNEQHMTAMDQTLRTAQLEWHLGEALLQVPLAAVAGHSKLR